MVLRHFEGDGLWSRLNGFGRWWHHKFVVQNGIQAFAKLSVQNALRCISENFNLKNFPGEACFRNSLENCAVRSPGGRYRAYIATLYHISRPLYHNIHWNEMKYLYVPEKGKDSKSYQSHCIKKKILRNKSKPLQLKNLHCWGTSVIHNFALSPHWRQRGYKIKCLLNFLIVSASWL